MGQVLADRYRIVRLLGEGGMGQVYEAQHLNINKRFAIKMLKPEVIGSAQSLQRFRQEAGAASSIGHENIVEIDDFATLPSGHMKRQNRRAAIRPEPCCIPPASSAKR